MSRVWLRPSLSPEECVLVSPGCWYGIWQTDSADQPQVSACSHCPAASVVDVLGGNHPSFCRWAQETLWKHPQHSSQPLWIWVHDLDRTSEESALLSWGMNGNDSGTTIMKITPSGISQSRNGPDQTDGWFYRWAEALAGAGILPKQVTSWDESPGLWILGLRCLFPVLGWMLLLSPLSELDGLCDSFRSLPSQMQVRKEGWLGGHQVVTYFLGEVSKIPVKRSNWLQIFKKLKLRPINTDFQDWRSLKFYYWQKATGELPWQSSG